MDFYLSVLNRIREVDNLYPKMLDKVEKYIKGEIDSVVLFSDTTSSEKGYLHACINMILNYREKEKKYYIELPGDMYFNTSGAYRIVILEDDFEPKPHHNNMIEIEGNFDNYNDIIYLYQRDWYAIISKFPYILDRMCYLTANDYSMSGAKEINFEEVKQRMLEHINSKIEEPKNGEPDSWWIHKEEAEYLPDEVIDSIKFVVPIQFFSRETAEYNFENIGTFEHLVSIKNSKENEIEENKATKRV